LAVVEVEAASEPVDVALRARRRLAFLHSSNTLPKYRHA